MCDYDNSLNKATVYPDATGAIDGRSYRAPSMAELHGKSAAHHAEMVEKNAKAQQFFAEHPEFDEFITLIRAGAIQIQI